MDKCIIAYNKYSGLIYDILQSDQDIDVYFKYYPLEMIESMDSFMHEGELPQPINDYLIRNNKLVKLTKDESYELSVYKRFLTDDERLLEKLKPTKSDIDKAEQTIEMLSLMQEVIL